MDRNTEQAYGLIDTIDINRSHWTRKFNHKTSFNAGYLIPFYVNTDIIPGTTIKNSTSIVCHMTTPLNPVIDNLYLDIYYFKCSKFWYWDHFRAMMGENNYGAWTQEIAYTEPKILTSNNNYYNVNDMATYMGVPPYKNINKTGGYSKMAVNAVIDIWNNWFRDQNLQAPIIIDKTDTNLTRDGTIQTGCGLLPVAKFHDYFTSCLPEPQKGQAVSIPLGTEAEVTGNLVSGQVKGNGKTLGLTNGSQNGGLIAGSDISQRAYVGVQAYNINVGTGGATSAVTGTMGVTTDETKSGIVLANTAIKGIANLSNATAATISALRLAFATQKILERDARSGTRYYEILKSHFGVSASDEALLVPEYIGGKRIPLNITPVIQNSSTDAESPLGHKGAMSITADVNEDFTKSFTKDDILIGVLCVRADHTYQQGMPRQFTRTERLDRYWPELAHVSNQPVYNYEIYVDGSDNDTGVFGYKEAWQEYMYHNNRISGELMSQYPQSLDIWHYGDDYSALPVLSSEWISEPREFIDRTLAVSSEVSHQFWADIYVEQDVTAPIPLSRAPGLIDHL